MSTPEYLKRKSFIAFLILAFSILMICCSSLYANAAQSQGSKASKKAVVTPAPVAIDNKILFYVQTKILSISPENRAEIITKRINKLIKDPLLDIKSIAISEGENNTDIVAGDLIIMTVTEDDAKTAGKERIVLANEYAGSIKAAIDTQRKEYSVHSIIFGTIFALFATMVFILLLIIIKKIFFKTYVKLQSWKDVRIHGLKFQKLEILSSTQITDAVVKAAKLLRALLIILLLYFYIPLVLSFFPWTKRYSVTIFGYIMSPLHAVGQSFIAFLPNLFFIAVIMAVTFYALKVIKFIFEAIERENINLPGFYPDWSQPTYKIVRFLVMAFTIVMIFPYLPGSDSPAFKGVSIFLGVLFSLGSTAAVANLVAGLILTYMRAFKLGDRVKISDTTGDIIEKTLLVTRVRTIKNEDITIPNAVVLGSHIINYSASAKDTGLILHTKVTIGYDAPWKQVHELLIAAAQETEYVLKEPFPFVLQTSLDDFYVSYEINAYTDKPNKMAVVYSNLHQNIQDRFNKAGVEIMSPHYSALRDGNQTTIPEQTLSKDYASSGFKINGLADILNNTGKHKNS
ncbi:MAG: mechanosensitive ion channel protein [Deltaproteobacteria bacterium HGW-Deltaproteobacteria-10]|nr:MAG: mechanosensitive ion channel protein [Deltaproteobacteria bacterium HGW-Deltaproteobacteria-10]